MTPQSIAAASGPAYGTLDRLGAGYDTQYGAARAIDDDPATFCCLLDDTPDAADVDALTIPPGGSRPVTGQIVFDLGRTLEVVAVKLIVRDSPGAYGPKSVDLFCAAGDGPAKEFAGGSENKAGIQDRIVGCNVPRLTTESTGSARHLYLKKIPVVVDKRLRRQSRAFHYLRTQCTFL